MDGRKTLKSRPGRRNLFAVLVCLNMLILTADVADAADPNLVAHWKFDEGSGTTAYDSASDNDGNITGASWTTGQVDGALDFDGSGDYVEVNNPADGSLDFGAGNFTISLWFKTTDTDGELVDKSGGGTGRARGYSLTIGTFGSANTIGLRVRDGSRRDIIRTQGAYNDGEWHHVAAVRTGSFAWNLNIYVDGVDVATLTLKNQGAGDISNSYNLSIGAKYDGGDTNTWENFLAGAIDEVMIFDGALSAEEILQLYRESLYTAFNPDPEDGATGIDPDMVLSWFPGRDAAWHDVYFGTNYSDVNDADTSSPEYMGSQDTNSWVPDGLEYDTTYYWRIDEVNGLNTWRGDVWSFTTSRVYYVDASATGADDGTSWADAYKYLQDALDDAQSGDELWVAEGIYRPDEDTAHPNGSGSRNATFRLRNGVAIKGGYAGVGEPDPDVRDIELYETILSGDLMANDGPNFANSGENSYHVVTGSWTNATALLDGFAITAGNADDDSWPNNYGGGMYNNNGSPTLTNCTFTGNLAKHGGGMHNHNGNPTVTNCTFSGNSVENGGGMCNWYDSSPTVTHCTFIGNSAGDSGGGMCNWYDSNPTVANCTFSGNSAENGGGMQNDYSSPTVANCTFSGNRASRYWNGGGMQNHESSPTVTHCTFIGNSAGDSGGGMNNSFNSNLTVTNCTFTGNSAKNGGGMHNHQSSPTLTNCTFSGNSAEYGGGGMNNWDYCRPALTNCTFTGNSAEGGGGMVSGKYSYPTVTNCTFSGNSATQRGGGVWNNNDSSSTLTNCILWSNTASTGSQIYNDWRCSATVNYCDVQGGWSGMGNIDADPCFVQPRYQDANGLWVEGDYHLLEGSPCIDAGDPNYVAGPNETDLDGNPRVSDGDNDGNSVVDMGAYEYRPPTPPELILELADDVMALNLHEGITNSLEAKLNAALGALEDENENNDIAAINTIGAFINAVEAHRGKKIPTAEADALIAAAQEIIELLSDG